MATTEPDSPGLLGTLERARELHRGRMLTVTAWFLLTVAPATMWAGQNILHVHDAVLLVAAVLCGVVLLSLVRAGRHAPATWLAVVVMLLEVGYFHVFIPHSELAVAYVAVILLIVATVRLPGVPPGAVWAGLAASALAMRTARWWVGRETEVDAWLSLTFDALVILTMVAALVIADRRRTDEEGERLWRALAELERREEEASSLRRVAERAAESERRSSDAKSAFLLRISHELRTPITAISGYAELIGEEESGPTACRDAARIRQAAGRLLELVDAVLTATGAEEGRTTLSPQAITLRSLVEPVLDRVTPVARSHGDELSLDASERTVVVDVSQVRQVLLNLLSNATRFTRDGDVRVEASTDGDVVLLRVSDTGVGIEAERLPLLFQPFSGASFEEGVGLGLVVCDRLVRAMGGTLRIDSVVNQGTTATVTLPQLAPAP